MDSDQTPINARPRRRPPQALEDLSLALRDNVVWPLEDRLLVLSDRGRAAVAASAVAVALAIGAGGLAVVSSGGSDGTAATEVAARVAPAPKVSAVPAPAPKHAPEPTLHGAAPVFKPAPEAQEAAGGSAAIASTAGASAANTGSAATDTISSTPSTRPTAARAATSSTAIADGPPAGPAAIAVAREFAEAFVDYETGTEMAAVRKAFKATTIPDLRRALLRRPPRQPAGVEVPQAKVVNVVPAPSHGTVYPLSVSLLRVGVTSELRLEMEQLKNEQWRVVNVLG